jgi:hypothetical protein
VSNPITAPDRDPALAAFARQHPDWTCWHSLNTRYYARLTADPRVRVIAEDLPELSIEIRRAESELVAS